MGKTKVSFDIERRDFESIKAVLEAYHMTQGEFFRQMVKEHLKNFDERIMNVYIIENATLVRKSIDKADYTIEIDSTPPTKELLEDFNFITSGYLIRNGVKERFYSKVR
ncbi:MAG: hypothetical protein Q9M40_08340, partial [Sulfurimonas sp.]|nr:hypothetical protein [Sulfurimonas sp.]